MSRRREDLTNLVALEGVGDRVVAAFRDLDRAAFVPEGSELEAYHDRPVSLPRGQTTSQPSLIARMIDAVDPDPGDRVLEVGTGYGFQTALLARLAKEVASVERFAELAEAAAANLRAAGIDNVEIVVGDGWKGYPARAPYDAIVVSAAAEEIPQALAEQLAEGGRVVIPIKRRMTDEVVLLRKSAGELTEERTITPARFVPLVHGEADAET